MTQSAPKVVTKRMNKSQVFSNIFPNNTNSFLVDFVKVFDLIMAITLQTDFVICKQIKTILHHGYLIEISFPCNSVGAMSIRYLGFVSYGVISFDV